MSDESGRFRRRAKECRDIAARAPDGAWRMQLNELAKDLDAEASKIEAEEERSRSPTAQMPPPAQH